MSFHHHSAYILPCKNTYLPHQTGSKCDHIHVDLADKDSRLSKKKKKNRIVKHWCFCKVIVKETQPCKVTACSHKTAVEVILQQNNNAKK